MGRTWSCSCSVNIMRLSLKTSKDVVILDRKFMLTVLCLKRKIHHACIDRFILEVKLDSSLFLERCLH